MTDRIPEEPDLHIDPKIIETAAKSAAELYSHEIGITGFNAPQTIKVPNTNMEDWRRIASDSRHLDSQIMTLANVLTTARDLRKKLPPNKLVEITVDLFHGIVFRDEAVKAFLTDIFLRKVRESSGIVNPQKTFRKIQELEIEDDLGLKPGICDLTLERVVRAAIVGTLSPIPRSPKTTGLP